MLSREQAQALTRAVHLLRPAWNEEGIYAALAKVKTRNGFDVALAALRAARDDGAKTPGVIPTDGPHWNELPPTPPSKGTYGPPTRGEACSTCGQRQTQCEAAWGNDHPFTPVGHDAARRTPAASESSEARANLAAARNELCSHGVPRNTCRGHDTPPGRPA